MKHRDVLKHQNYSYPLKPSLHVVSGRVQTGRHVCACAEASSFYALVYNLSIKRDLRVSSCGGGEHARTFCLGIIYNLPPAVSCYSFHLFFVFSPTHTSP